MPKRKFTDKQQRFIDKYSVCLNGTVAAKEAGYSERTAHAAGARLLSNVRVRAEIEKHIARVAAKDEISVEWVLAGLKENVERCMGGAEVFDKEGNPTGVFAWKPSEANKAYELIGKHLQMFTDNVKHSGKIRQELTGADGQPIQTEDVTAEKMARLKDALEKAGKLARPDPVHSSRLGSVRGNGQRQ